MVAEGGEGENPLRGRGGIPASFPSRSPPPKQPFQPTPTPSPGSHQTRRFAKKSKVFVAKKPQAPGGPGPKPWGPGPQAPWRPGPQAPEAWIPPLSPVDFLQAKFLTSCCVSNPWVRVWGALDGFRRRSCTVA